MTYSQQDAIREEVQSEILKEMEEIGKLGPVKATRKHWLRVWIGLESAELTSPVPEIRKDARGRAEKYAQIKAPCKVKAHMTWSEITAMAQSWDAAA